MSHADRDAVKPVTTQLRNLTDSIEQGEVVPSILSVVMLDDDDGRPTGEYNVSVIVRPKSAPPFLCGIVSMSGPNREPLACAYPPGHDGDHSWATLPTFAPGYSEHVGIARSISPGNYSAEVYELIQGAIDSTDNTPRTARLRKALEAFGVE